MAPGNELFWDYASAHAHPVICVLYVEVYGSTVPPPQGGPMRRQMLLSRTKGKIMTTVIVEIGTLVGLFQLDVLEAHLYLITYCTDFHCRGHHSTALCG
jgi:hypothetical protein